MSSTVTFKFGVGDQVKDEITKFEGIVVCNSMWLNGCARVGVQSRKLEKDGGVGKIEMFDEHHLKLVKKGAIQALGATATEPTGGPQRGEGRAMQR